MFSRLRSFSATISNDRVEPFGVHFRAQITDPNSPNYQRPLIPQRYEGKYVSFVHADRDYDDMDVIVDIFQEEPRLSARRRHSLDSPLDQWYNGRVTFLVLKEALQHYSRLNSFTIREAFYKVNFLVLIVMSLHHLHFSR
jgi:hypothetical protein